MHCQFVNHRTSQMRRNEVLSAQQTLKFYPKAAYLNPGDLSGDEEAYQQFIDSSFAEIIGADVKHLIIGALGPDPKQLQR